MAGDADFSEIEELERLLLEPDVRSNTGRLESILAPDFVEFGRSGRVYGRDDIIATLVGERGTATLSISDIAFRRLAHEAVLITYRSTRSTDGEILVSLRSSLWIKAADGWRIIFHQGTPTAN